MAYRPRYDPSYSVNIEEHAAEKVSATACREAWRSLSTETKSVTIYGGEMIPEAQRHGTTGGWDLWHAEEGQTEVSHAATTSTTEPTSQWFPTCRIRSGGP